jgi:TP901 family phage tail tape measure protein
LAGPGSDINANVGLNINDGGINKILGDLDAKVEATLLKLAKLGDIAAGAGDKLTKKAQKELGNVDAQAKQIQRALQQFQTITNAQGRGARNNVAGILGTGLEDQKIAKSANAVREFRRTLEESQTTAEKLKARINAITTETANLARQGQAQTDGQIRKQAQLTSTLKEYEALSSKLAVSTGKIGVLSPENQRKMESFVLKGQELKRVFSDLAGDGRRTDFAFLTDAMRTITAEMEKEVGLLARQERLEAGLLQNTRQRAQELLNITSRDRQNNLERSSTSLAGRLTPSQLAVGTGLGDTGLENRLTRVTAAYSAAKRNLNAALQTDSGASEAQIAKLVGQVQRFDAKIIETLALQGRRARDSILNSKQEADAIDKVTAAQKRLADLQRSITTREITRGIRDSEQALKDFQKQLDSIGSNGAEKISPLTKAFKGLLGDGGAGLAARVAIYSLAASAIYGMINAVRDGIKFVTEFDDKLGTLQAISGATAGQMVSLSSSILEVGKNSRFSVIDLVDAATQLAQAGFSVGDTQTALQAVSDFAAASGTSIKESSDLITAALGAFQLQAGEASRVTDVFTAALNRSKLTSQQIAQAIQYVGTTAYEQNISLEQLVATIGSVAQAGVRSGSTLGTGYRQLLVDLANPTEKLTDELKKLGLTVGDVDVKTRGFNTVLKTLKDAGFGASQAYQGLEVRAAAFFLAAKNNIDVSQQLQLAESQRGVATLASARAMDTLTAQTQRLQNILGALAADAVPVEFLKNLAKQAADLAEKVGATGREYEKLQAQNLSGENGPIAKLQTQLELTAKEGNLAPEWLRNIQNSLYDLTSTTDGYTEAARLQSAENDRLATATANAADATNKQAQVVAEAQNEFQKLLTQGPSVRQDSIETAIITNQLTSRFQGLAGMLGTSANGYDNLVLAMKRYNAQQLAMLGNSAAGQAAAGQNEFAGMTRQANSQLASLRQTADYRRLSAAQRSQFENGVRNQGQAGGIQGLNDFFNTAKGLSEEFRTAGRAFSSLLSNRLAKGGEVKAASGLADSARIRSNPLFQQVANRNLSTQAALTRTQSATAGQTAEQRRAAFAPIEKDLLVSRDRIDFLMKSNKGNQKVINELLQLRSETDSQLNQIKGQGVASKKETRESEAAQKKADAARKAAGRAAERAQDTFNKNELTVSQAKLKASDKALSAFLSGQGQNFGINDIQGLFDKGEEALNTWITDRRSVLADAITKAGMTDAQAKQLTEAANDEIEAKQKATIQRQVEILDRAVTNFVERRTRSIDNTFKGDTFEETRGLARQEGLSAGLNNPLLRGVPEYTKTIQKRNADIAQDRLNRKMVFGGANERRIDETQAIADDIKAQLDKLQALKNTSDAVAEGSEGYAEAKRKSAAYAEEMVRLSDVYDAQRDKVLDLTAANDALRAQYDAEKLKPTTFGEATSQAADAFRINNDIGISLKERLFGGLGNALESIHGSFQTFFTDVIAGTKGVGQAFGDMAKAVVNAILEMAARAVATQIFGLLLSFIPGAAASGGISASQGLSNYGAISVPAINSWHGGQIGNQTPQRLIGGGGVGRGLPTRDSVLVHAAKGEFMMRQSSVESIGHDLLNDMNNRGAAALGKLGGSNLVMPQSRLDSSVYVVLPEERPSLGENDVLAIVSRDVLRGGATKQLIRQVSSGG